MHLCPQQLIWARLTKGRLRYPVSAAYDRLGGGKADACDSFIRMVCQGPAGGALCSGGPSEDGLQEMRTLPSASHHSSLLLPGPRVAARLPAQPDCLCHSARGEVWGCVVAARDAQPEGRKAPKPRGQRGRPALLWVWLFPHPCVIAGLKVARSQGIFQRHFSNSHFISVQGPRASSQQRLAPFQAKISAF